MPGDKTRCIEAGAVEYLSKPISLGKLHTCIQDIYMQHVYSGV